MQTASLNLGSVHNECQKCQATERLQRHHMGCQFMFVRHFEKRKGQERYDEFVRRYHAFDVRDICTLCDDCHKAIHILYMPIIGRHCFRLRKPMARWTWRQAEILMRDLTEYCERWLAKP